MDPNDREIYRAAIRGDRAAFETIIRASSRSLFAIAYGVLQNRAEAEDAVQDTFIKAWKSRWRVRDPEKFPAWLASIVRHRARDLARQRKSNALIDELDEIADEASANQDAIANEAYLQNEVHCALAYATIERTLGLTNGALRGILGRALQTMRQRLQPALASLR